MTVKWPTLYEAAIAVISLLALIVSFISWAESHKTFLLQSEALGPWLEVSEHQFIARHEASSSSISLAM